MMLKLSGTVRDHGFVSKRVQGSSGELSPQKLSPPSPKEWNGRPATRSLLVSECGRLAYAVHTWTVSSPQLHELRGGGELFWFPPRGSLVGRRTRRAALSPEYYAASRSGSWIGA